MIIKSGPLTNLTDARFFASKGVDMISFNIDPSSEYYLPPHEIQEIKKWIYGPQLIGEFHNSNATQALETAMILDLNYIQTDVNGARDLSSKDIDLIINSSPEEIGEINKHDFTNIKYVQLDFPNLDFEDRTHLSFLDTLAIPYPTLLNTILTKERLDLLLQKTMSHGIVIEGSNELKVGEKEFDLLDELFAVLDDRL